MKTGKADYGILAILSMGYLFFIYTYQSVPKYILAATIVFAITYIIWGVVHHLKARTFHLKVVLEYFLVALLGVAIVSTLLL